MLNDHCISMVHRLSQEERRWALERPRERSSCAGQKAFRCAQNTHLINDNKTDNPPSYQLYYNHNNKANATYIPLQTHKTVRISKNNLASDTELKQGETPSQTKEVLRAHDRWDGAPPPSLPPGAVWTAPEAILPKSAPGVCGANCACVRRGAADVVGMVIMIT